MILRFPVAFFKNFFYFCSMESISVKIVSRSEDLPQMTCRNFFHSAELFKMLEQTPGNSPYMVFVHDGNNRVLSHLLATIRRRGTFLFPFAYTQGRIYGEGEYEDDADKDELFQLMLRAITRKFVRKLCLYIEFSDLTSKMFGYRHFRQNDYFPVRWMQIHNSLHSKTPRERISNKLMRRIENVYKAGIETREAVTDGEISDFCKMLRNYYRFKVQRFIPRKQLFEHIGNSENGKVYITQKKNKIIGGCAIVYSRNNAYLWYIASRRKSFAKLHPNLVTVWNALQTSYEKKLDHLYFMNVGLPFRRNIYRDFILRFGGKPVSTYRWFRSSIGWVNKLLKWVYRE